jgi:hypothetical protein
MFPLDFGTWANQKEFTSAAKECQVCNRRAQPESQREARFLEGRLDKEDASEQLIELLAEHIASQPDEPLGALAAGPVAMYSNTPPVGPMPEKRRQEVVRMLSRGLR